MANVTFPRDITNDIDNTKVVKPEYLYAYTDPNAIGTTSLYAWTCADNNETCYTKTSTLASNIPLYDKDSEVIGSISGLIIDNNKFLSDINYTFTNAETLSILTNLYNDEFITTQADSLEGFIATILGLQPSDISLADLQFVFSEVYTDSMGSNITCSFDGIDVDPNYYFLIDDTAPSNGLALFLFLGTDRVFFIGYFDDTKIDINNYGSEEIKTAMNAFLSKKIRTQTDFYRIFLDTQSGDIATGYLGVEITDETFNSESGSLDILAGDKGNTLLYCFDANSPWTNGTDSYGTTAFAESSGNFGELTSDSSISITSGSWIGLSSIFDLIEASNAPSYDRDSDKDVIEYDKPVTLYTDSTTLITGMTLYDNTGTDTGYKVGEVLTANSFNLLVRRVLNVDGFTYTTDSNDDVILTSYVGENSDVVIPEPEEI